jgi:hypothetical protein
VPAKDLDTVATPPFDAKAFARKLRRLDLKESWDAARFRWLLDVTPDHLAELTKSDRLLFLNALAWDLGEALGKPEIADTELLALLERLPQLMAAASADVKRPYTHGVYMFWDLVLFANRPTLGTNGLRATLLPHVIEALLRMRFGPQRRLLQRSTDHGLFHLLDAMDVNRDNWPHP